MYPCNQCLCIQLGYLLYQDIPTHPSQMLYKLGFWPPFLGWHGLLPKVEKVNSFHKNLKLCYTPLCPTMVSWFWYAPPFVQCLLVPFKLSKNEIFLCICLYSPDLSDLSVVCVSAPLCNHTSYGWHWWVGFWCLGMVMGGLLVFFVIVRLIMQLIVAALVGILSRRSFVPH